MQKKDTKYINRGHEAEWPHHIPFAGWVDIGKRVFKEMKNDNVPIVSAGVAFYFFLSLFPTIIAAISIYSLVLEPSQIEDQIQRLDFFLPPSAFEIINDFLQPVIERSRKEIGWGLVFSIALSLWSTNKGTSALFQGINIAYDQEETRGFIKKNLITLFFTLGALVTGLISLLFVIFFPILVENIGLPFELVRVLEWSRWVILAIILVSVLCMAYKIAPNRTNPKFGWASWGAVIGTIFWILGSLGFSWYVKNFGSYDDLYGSFAAVVILMLWLFLTAFIVLMGAEINSEMEHQTRIDTTIGAPKPMGERNAYHADRVAGKDIEDTEPE